MTERAYSENCLSDLTFDAWDAHALDAQAMARIERHMAQCARCRARHNEHAQERADLSRTAPSLRPLDLPVRNAPTAAAGLRKLWSTRKLAIVASCALVLLGLRAWRNEASALRNTTPHFDVLVEHDKQVTPVEAGALVHAGDLLRFTYSTGRNAYLALLNADARRAVAYYPLNGSQAPLVAAGNDVPLDFRVQLDDKPRPEHLLAVFCPRPFDTQPLLAALASSNEVPTDIDCQIDVLQLKKQAR